MKNDIEKFVEACILKGEADEMGNSSKGNKYYKTIESIYNHLKANNRLNELAILLNHEQPYVKLWSSAYMLPITPIESQKVLEELSGIKTIIGFTAKMTLKEWLKGNLKF